MTRSLVGSTPIQPRSGSQAFVRIHKTLRCTPATEVGVSDRLWTCREIAGLLEEAEGEKSAAA
jgi:hypothetical protein